MRTIRVPFPQISSYEKTRLIQISDKPEILNTSAGETSFYVRNTKGIVANDFLIVDAFESEDAEIVKVQAVDQEAHLIDLSTPVYQTHSLGSAGLSGAVVMKTPYNQVKIYRGLLADMSDHVLLATVDLRPDSAYTYYNDPTGLSTHYYSYVYFNNHGAGTAGTQTLYTENDYDAVLTVENLVQNFMFGLDLTDDDGNPFPRGMLEFAIRAAVDSLEKTLQIKIKPTQILNEMQDYYRSDYLDFAFIQLNEYPIVSVEEVKIKYPTAQAEIIFPTEWYQINPFHGQVHLIPTSGSLSQILIGRGGDYLTFVWKGWDWMPNLWRINYTAGFATGQIPNDIIAVIGKMACFYPLNIAGDLVGGIAIASKSIGIDGLSQSINTTSCVHPDVLTLEGKRYFKISDVGIPTIKWNGYLISIRVSGKEDGCPLMITPDHLILTEFGWIEAKDVKIGYGIQQEDGTFKKVSILEDKFYIGQLYDKLNQPNEKYITFQGVIHNSPENAGYSARLREFERELKVEIPRLQVYYKGMKMSVA